MKPGLDCGAVEHSRFARARHGPNRPVRVDRTDAIVVGVGDDHPAGGVHVDADRSVEPRLGRRTVAVAGDAIAGDCRNTAVRCNAANRVVPGVGDIERAGCVDGKAGRRAEFRGFPGSIREAVVRIPLSRKRGLAEILRMRCVAPASAT